MSKKALSDTLRSAKLRGSFPEGNSLERKSLNSTLDTNAIRDEVPASPSVRAHIPESELTPCVRAAIGALQEEVRRLQLGFDEMRSRLADMQRAADQDMLLPVLNRRALLREIARFLDFAARYGTRSSLLFLDLNGFKAVNDRHGHAAGDSVLQQFCDLLGANIRSSDVLGRLGGDEFGIILPGVSAQQALEKGQALLRCVGERPPLWDGQGVELSFACGACELRKGTDAVSALAEADRVMYAAKRLAVTP